MSREVFRCVFLYLMMRFASIVQGASPSGVFPENCLELDAIDLEDYLLKLKLENVPTINMMIGGFECPVTALPFGVLRSDWARLELLRDAQTEDSILREKLLRLFRILAIAYQRMEQTFVPTYATPMGGGRFEGKSSNGAIFSEQATSSRQETRETVKSTRKEEFEGALLGEKTSRGNEIDGLNATTVRCLSEEVTINSRGGQTDNYATEGASTLSSSSSTVFTLDFPLRRGRIRKIPTSMRRPPTTSNGFWKFLRISKRIPAVTESIVQFTRASSSSGKRGGSNTDNEKNFRAFFNLFENNEGGDLNSTRQGFSIDCGGQGKYRSSG